MVYVENNGICWVLVQYYDQFFVDDMCFFSDILLEVIYFCIVFIFEVDVFVFSWLIILLFICVGGWIQDGVMFDFYQVG